MTRVAVSKWGNSSSVRLPKAVMEEFGIKQSEVVEMTVQNGKGVIDPVLSKSKKITLSWIISEMKRLGPGKEPASVDWGSDEGSEIIDDNYSRRR
jgi:antitoxin MazE